MCTAIDLLKSNIHNFIILEKSSAVGGTWHDNKYPGCCCDVWSLLYSYSFEQNPNWTREYPGQEEILDYLTGVAAKWNLYRHIRFNTSVDRAVWDDEGKEWRTDVRIAGGSKDAEFGEGQYSITSDFLVSAVGQLNMPKYPDIAGLEDFKGQIMHSARWDWTYDIRGKKVGMIGNGATAAQIGPEIAKEVEHLTVFQRTPNWIIPRMDAEVSPLRRTVQKYFPPFMHRIRAGMMEFRESTFVAIVQPQSEMAQMFKDMCLDMMHAALPDRPDMWEKLTPNYAVGCKRIQISDDVYPMLARDNVKLETRPIDRITESGISVKSTPEEPTVTDTDFDFDCVVLATGFRTVEFMHPIEIIGRNGVPLNDIWKNGAIAYNGTTVPGLPNFGMLYGPNTNLGHNSIILMIESQSKQISTLVSAVLEARKRDGAGSNQGDRRDALSFSAEKRIALTPKRDVVDSYNEEIQGRLKDSSFNDPNCNSWYKDPKSGRITNNWASTVWEYQQRMEKLIWNDYEDGNKVIAMRKGQKEVHLPRVREDLFISDKMLAGLTGAAVVAAGVAGWVLRNQRIMGRVRA